jgi:hypothetical protein
MRPASAAGMIQELRISLFSSLLLISLRDSVTGRNIPTTLQT